MSDPTQDEATSAATMQENIDQAVDDAVALNFATLAAVKAAFHA